MATTETACVKFAAGLFMSGFSGRTENTRP